jgi:hypothetical protein
VGLFTNLSAARVQRGLKDSSGAAISQLDVLPRNESGYAAVYTVAGGVGVSTSADLSEFQRRGTFKWAGASSPGIVAVSGRAPVGGGQWWVLAFETPHSHSSSRQAATAPATPATLEALAAGPSTGVGFALFTSEAQLLSGSPSRVFVPPNAPLLPAGQRQPFTSARYGSPTIYSAVYSQRGGQTTVDVVLGLSWADDRNRTHPGNAMLTALSPDAATQVSEPEFNSFFSFDGAGYDGTGSKAAGPLHWEQKLRQASSAGLRYTGSVSAYVPCGAGCADPRDRAGGNADGQPGTIKLSIIAGIDDGDSHTAAGGSSGSGSGSGSGSSKLLLWAWDPIVKVRWLWPSGFGTAQGGFNNSAIILQLPGVELAAKSTPKIRVLPCPEALLSGRSEAGQRSSLCFWVGVMTTDGQLTFYKPLTAQEDTQHYQFSPRYRTQLPPPPPPSSLPVSTEPPPSAATRDGLTLRNDAFHLTVAPSGGSFTITELQSGMTRTFNSTFAVISCKSNPLLSDLKDAGHHPNTSVKSLSMSLYSIADAVPSYWQAKQTASVFEAGDGPPLLKTVTSCTALNDTALSLGFSSNSGEVFSLQASLALPAGTELPRLRWSLTTAADSSAFFSVGFLGSPSLAVDEAVPFAQPSNCFSTEQPNPRCPLKESIVVPDISANLPYSMVADRNDSSVALIADPAMFPFQPCVAWPNAPPGFSDKCPTNVCQNGAKADACQNRGWASEARSSLGIINHGGDTAAPLIFAPVLGGFGSQVSKLPHRTHSFIVQLLVHKGSPSATYRKLASRVYGFQDERDNSGPGSLNAAIERMGDYLADADGSNFMQWDAIQKYSFYWMDDACAFKPLDFMSGLSIALTIDDDRMYTLFARETAKFALSHSDKDKYLWPYVKTTGINTAGHFGMGQNHGAGFASAAQIMQIYRLTGSHSSALPMLAELSTFNASLACPNADSNYDVLLFFESTTGWAREHWWNCTMEAALHLMMVDEHTPQPPTKFKCTNADFFVSLFQLTKDERYKHAAQLCEANCEYKYQVFPRATAADGELATVDVGNRSLSYWWTHGRWGSWGWPLETRGMWSPERTVPTWRASHNGLVTSGGGGGGGWLGTLSLDSPVRMLRVATLSNDSFARALTRASIVGRFGHFPGDFQSKPLHTLLWEAPDLADHVLPQETQTTWNTGHFWPVAGVVLDFLLTDAADRSNNAIFFPSTFADTIPFGRLYSPALGKGRFYDTAEGVFAWIPSGLFRAVSNPQMNWLAAYSSSSLYVALLSQSFREETVSCELNPALVGGLEDGSTILATTWVNNLKQERKIEVKSGRFAVSVPPKGIVALRLAGAQAKTRTQHKVLRRRSSSNSSMPPLSPSSRVVSDSEGAFGIVSGLVLRWGEGMTELYAYSQANSTMFGPTIEKDKRATSHTVFDQVIFHWRVDDAVAESNVTGTMFPFDFTVPLPDDCKTVSFSFSGVSSQGATLHTKELMLPVSDGATE